MTGYSTIFVEPSGNAALTGTFSTVPAGTSLFGVAVSSPVAESKATSHPVWSKSTSFAPRGRPVRTDAPSPPATCGLNRTASETAVTFAAISSVLPSA